MPTLFLLGGESDNRIYLDGLDELRAAFPNARPTLIPGQHHVAYVFAAETFAKLVVDFCGSLQPRPSPSPQGSGHCRTQDRGDREAGVEGAGCRD